MAALTGAIAHAAGKVRHRRLITLGTHAEESAMRPTMSAELSRRVTDAAVAAAAAVAVTVVTVDESGVLKELRRMDGAPLISVQTAVSKAYAAAAIGMPPDEFYAAIESDGAAVASFATRPGLALIGGGIPVVADGQVAGAVGVAGAMTAAEDRRIAEAAIERLTSSDAADPRYLLGFLCLPAVLGWIRSRSSGTTIPFITARTLGHLMVTLPPLSEQRHIGSALLAFDEQITAHQEFARTAANARTTLAEHLMQGALTLR
jgi:glc operon protein GlcG